MSTSRAIDRDIRWSVWERDDFTCQRCGQCRHLEVDHVIPRSEGGGDEPSNLQTLCGSCNRRKGPGNPLGKNVAELNREQQRRAALRGVQVRRMREAGQTMSGIASAWGVSRTVVYRLLRSLERYERQWGTPDDT